MTIRQSSPSWIGMRSFLRAVIAIALVVSLGTGCAHRQPTNKQIAGVTIAVVGIGLLVWLAVEQCEKGANYCDNDPPPGQ